MLFIKPKPLFIHIPKTGGESIKKSLGIKITHRRIDCYTSKELKNAFIFCFVRNPWDRLVSLYHYFLYHSDIIERKRILKKNPNAMLAKQYDGFQNFCLSLNDTIIEEVLFPKCISSYGSQMKPQLWWIKNNKDIKVDFIGRFENIDKDFATVCNHLKIKTIKLPVLNSSIHNSYYKYYTEETKDLVARIYYEDIKEFGYSFKNNNE